MKVRHDKVGAKKANFTSIVSCLNVLFSHTLREIAIKAKLLTAAAIATTLRDDLHG